MERFNIAKALLNAPKGLELWSDAHGVVELEKVDTNSCYPIFVKCGNGVPDNFRDNGALYYSESFDYPCTLWPSKDHRSWENWQSVLFPQSKEVVTIANEEEKFFILPNGRVLTKDGVSHMVFYDGVNISHHRYATPEEREQFFKELAENGYRWDANKKELNQWREDYTNNKIDKAANCLENQGIIDRLDSIFNLLNERLPIRLVPFTDTYPRPIEPWYKSQLNDVQANTGKEEEQCSVQRK